MERALEGLACPLDSQAFADALTYISNLPETSHGMQSRLTFAQARRNVLSHLILQSGALSTIFPIINRRAYSLPLRCKAMNALGTLCAHVRVAEWLVAHKDIDHSEICNMARGNAEHAASCPLRRFFPETLIFFISEESLFARSDAAFTLQFLVKFANEERLRDLFAAGTHLVASLANSISKLSSATVGNYFSIHLHLRAQPTKSKGAPRRPSCSSWHSTLLCGGHSCNRAREGVRGRPPRHRRQPLTRFSSSPNFSNLVSSASRQAMP